MIILFGTPAALHQMLPRPTLSPIVADTGSLLQTHIHLSVTKIEQSPIELAHPRRRRRWWKSGERQHFIQKEDTRLKV